MVRACGSGVDVAYEGSNVSATNYGIWHFVQGPGVDDPILGIGQTQGSGEGLTKELYWVTDGQGRQYATGFADGGWNTAFDPGTGSEQWFGYLQAGGTTEARGFNASRTEAAAIPGVSYFRNRIYDQSSGQWTQEDPAGLAGG